jgi:hypothetical protein
LLKPNRIRIGQTFILISVIAIIAGGLVRYVQAPSFWLDEAFVAVSLRNPSKSIFERLEYAQYFPRIYLSSISVLRDLFGYKVWVLRLLPFISFIVGTCFWGKVLAKRSRHFWLLGLISGGLLIGANYWLDQAIQLKQYTFDVMLALIPFLVEDSLFNESFGEGKHKAILVMLAVPCLLSYTYPMALGARILGCYLYYGRHKGWRIKSSPIFTLALTIAIAMGCLWETDLQFNLKESASYFAYWNECILSSQLPQDLGGALRLFAKFVWGWHGRMPLVTTGMVPLQTLGIYWVISRWKKGSTSDDESCWGSRSVGSLVLLVEVIASSIFVNYPICAGRVTLFAQIHTQILAIEGALFILTFWNKRKVVTTCLLVFVVVLLFHSSRQYTRYVLAEPDENINPMLPLIERSIANTIWVHSCSVAQVRSLPAPLPVENILLDTKEKLPERGQKVWVLWTHLGSEACKKQFDKLRERAISWEVVHEGPGRGLALAQF